jgi:hypothetical protein
VLQNEAAAALAQRAAELLVEPPEAHDAFGFLAWEELVLSTAARIGRIAGCALESPSDPGCEEEQPTTTSVTGAMLISLARLVRTRPELAGERLAALANRRAAQRDRERLAAVMRGRTELSLRSR